MRRGEGRIAGRSRRRVRVQRGERVVPIQIQTKYKQKSGLRTTTSVVYMDGEP